MHGERSKTTAYRIAYIFLKPVIPLLRRFFPGHILTTEEIGRAMIKVAQSGAPRKILEVCDIQELARPPAA